MSQATVKERPLIFTAESVRAILEGRKTQSRRAVKLTKDLLWYGATLSRLDPNPDPGFLPDEPYADGHPTRGGQYLHVPCLGGSFGEPTVQRLFCAHGPGDRLWVRETHHIFSHGDPSAPGGIRRDQVVYAADDEGWECKWRPSIFMPRRHARLFLEVVSVRVERLQQISEQDCIAEGIQLPAYTRADGTIGPLLNVTASPAPSVFLPENRPWTEADYWRHTFAIAWNRINGKGAWEANPHVWAIAFKRVQP